MFRQHPLWLIGLASLLLGCQGAGTGGGEILMRQDTEPPGAHCVQGGRAIHVGRDGNANTRLDEEEIERTLYVCQFDESSLMATLEIVAPGERCLHGGHEVLLGMDLDTDQRLEDTEIFERKIYCQESTQFLVQLGDTQPGTKCVYGGVTVSIGADQNGNGKLESEEIIRVEVLCPKQTLPLTRVDPEKPGPNCPQGGSAIRTGLDGNANGQLDEREVLSTRYDCNDVIGSTVSIRTREDLIALQHARVILGSLIISSNDLERIELPLLEAIAGSLLVSDNPALSALRMSALKVVGGSLDVVANPGLGQLSLPALDQIDERLLIQENHTLHDLGGLPRLKAAGGLTLRNNRALVSLGDWSALLLLRGRLEVIGNAALERLAVSSPGDLRAVQVSGNPSLAGLAIAAGGADSPGVFLGPISIEDNRSLATVAMLAREVHGDVIVQSNPALSGISFDRLERVFGHLKLVGNPLTQLEVSSGQSRPRLDGGLWLAGSELVSVQLSSLFSEIGEDLHLSENPRLRAAELRGKSPGYFHGAIEIRDNPALADLTLGPGDILVRADLTLAGNHALLSCARLDNLQTVGGSLVLQDNGKLGTLSLDRLQRLGGVLWISTNPALTAVRLPALQSAERLQLEGNPRLRALELGALTDLQDLQAEDNPALPTCQLERLAAQVKPAKTKLKGNDDQAKCE